MSTESSEQDDNSSRHYLGSRSLASKSSGDSGTRGAGTGGTGGTGGASAGTESCKSNNDLLSLPYPEIAGKRSDRETMIMNAKATQQHNDYNYDNERIQRKDSANSKLAQNNNISNNDLPYQDAGLPIRRQSQTAKTTKTSTRTATGNHNDHDNSKNSSKRKSRVKLGAKLKSKLTKLKKKRDSKYHQHLHVDEETGRIKLRLPPSMQEVNALTENGNSLPNLAPSRKKRVNNNPFSVFKQKRDDDVVGHDKENDTKDHNEHTTCSNCFCYTVIFFFFLMILLILGGSENNRLYHHAPTFAPEPTRPPSIIHDGDNSGHGDFTIHQWKVHEKLASISSADIDLPNTSQYKAAQWMIYSDEMGYDENSPYLYQR